MAEGKTVLLAKFFVEEKSQNATLRRMRERKLRAHKRFVVLVVCLQDTRRRSVKEKWRNRHVPDERRVAGTQRAARRTEGDHRQVQRRIDRGPRAPVKGILDDPVQKLQDTMQRGDLGGEIDDGRNGDVIAWLRIAWGPLDTDNLALSRWVHRLAAVRPGDRDTRMCTQSDRENHNETRQKLHSLGFFSICLTLFLQILVGHKGKHKRQRFKHRVIL